MNVKILAWLNLTLTCLLAVMLVLVGMELHDLEQALLRQPPQSQMTEPAAAPTVPEPPTEPPQVTAPPAPTQAPTEPPATQPTQPPTEPEPTAQRYLLSFVGDCTLGILEEDWYSQFAYVRTVGENYEYPFANVVDYTKQDDFTIANLETALTDGGTAQEKQFAFRGPTAFTGILTQGSVEAVTLANNHSMDYGWEGYADTKSVLTQAEVAYVENMETALYTTDRGLVIGLYASSLYFDREDMEAEIQKLRDDGAELIICAFHWGDEGSYHPNAYQQFNGRAAIDAGADIVYGHHPHVLQPIEEYNGGVIFYSLGNFTYGGNHFPMDYDTALIQQEIIREPDGSIRLGTRRIVPASMSSADGYNNFQPTPYEPGSEEYLRVLSKLDGTFTGENLSLDNRESYGEETEPEETEPEQTAPAA